MRLHTTTLQVSTATRFMLIVVMLLVNCYSSSNLIANEPIGRAFTEAERLFQQDPRWLGADAALSIPLSKGRILWLFGDTFVATSNAHMRSESEMVRNTIVPFLVSMGLDREKAAKIMSETGIVPTVRPETIDVARFVELANRCVETTTHCVSPEEPS